VFTFFWIAILNAAVEATASGPAARGQKVGDPDQGSLVSPEKSQEADRLSASPRFFSGGAPSRRPQAVSAE